jgi:hypothetical protein
MKQDLTEPVFMPDRSGSTGGLESDAVGGFGCPSLSCFLRAFLKKGGCGMVEKYASERLLDELPRPLINFIWYLWEAYCDQTVEESVFLLKPGESGQRVVISQFDKSVEQDFGTSIDATILIQRDGSKYCMSRR